MQAALKPILKQVLPPVIADRRYLLEAAKQLHGVSDIQRLRRNARFRNMYRGERCFVLGNGPSINQIDLRRLEREHILTVNGFIFQEQCKRLRPIVHTMVDPVYFNGSFDGGKTLVDLGHLPPSQTEFFFPIYARSLLAEYITPPPDRPLNYLLVAGDMRLHHGKSDITGCVPTYQTVAAFSLLTAIYMGFSKIYIVGCDLDLLANVLSVDPLIIRDNYFYNPNSTTNYTKFGWTYQAMCFTVGNMIESFAHARRSASPEQAIYNAGVGGCLELFPRVSYESLF